MLGVYRRQRFFDKLRMTGAGRRPRRSAALQSASFASSVPQREQSRWLLATELAVAGIAHTGHDVAAFVEVSIDGAEVNLHVVMRLGKFLDAFGRGEQAEVLDLLDAPLLKPRDGHARGTARGQHRVEHK